MAKQDTLIIPLHHGKSCTIPHHLTHYVSIQAPEDLYHIDIKPIILK